MKKNLLLSAIALSSLLAIGQTTETGCDLGYTATSATDNFKTVVEYGDSSGGVFWFGADKNGSDITFERKSADGQLVLDVTQADSQFEPIGFGFGDSNGDGTGTPVLLDISGNPVFEISATNNSATETIQVRLAVQDESNYKVELNTDATNAEPYLGQIVMTLDPGATEILTGTFEGGAEGIYDSTACVNEGATPTGDNNCIIMKADLTKISTVLVTVINAEQPESNSYQPLALTDVPVTINYVKIGVDCEFSSLGLNDKVRTLNATLYPNPTSSKVNFSEELEDVAVFNSRGIQVFSAAKATSIDVTDFSEGIYFLQTAKGSKSFVVE